MQALNISETLNAGKHPVHLDDLIILQKSIFDLAKAIAYNSTDNPEAGVLVGGCRNYFNGGVGSFASTEAGVIYHNGKAWFVPSLPATSIAAGQNLYLVFNIAPSRPTVPYQSGALFQVHVRNQCNFVVATTAPPNSILANTVLYNPTFMRRISALEAADTAMNSRVNVIELFLPSLTASVYDPWQEVATGDLTALVSTPIDAANSQIRYKIMGKTCHFVVTIQTAAGSTGSTFDITYPGAGVITKAGGSVYIHGMDIPGAVSAFVPCCVQLLTDKFRIHRSTTGANLYSFSCTFPLS